MRTQNKEACCSKVFCVLNGGSFFLFLRIYLFLIRHQTKEKSSENDKELEEGEEFERDQSGHKEVVDEAEEGTNEKIEFMDIEDKNKIQEVTENEENSEVDPKLIESNLGKDEKSKVQQDEEEEKKQLKLKEKNLKEADNKKNEIISQT